MPEMTAEQAAEWGKTLSFEKVWAALMENREQFRETDRKMAETDRKMAELAEQIRIEVEQRKAEAEERRVEAEQRKAEAEKRRVEEAEQRQAEAEQRKAEDEQRRVEDEKRRAEYENENREFRKEFDATLKSIKELSKNMDGVNRSPVKWSEERFAAKLWKKFNALGYEFTKGSRNITFLENDQKIAQVDVFLENGEYAMPVDVKVELDTRDIDKHLERIEKVRLYMDKRNDTRKLMGAAGGAVVPESVRDYAHKKGLYVLVQSGKSVLLTDAPEGFNPRKW